MCTLWSRLRYLEGPSRLLLCVSKKIVAVRHTNQITFKEMWKKLGFWKNEAQMSLEYSNNTSCFDVKLFFQRVVKILLWPLLTCSRYLEGSPNLVLYVSEKIGLVRHFNQNISRRKANGRVFTPPLCKLILKKSTLCPYVMMVYCMCKPVVCCHPFWFLESLPGPLEWVKSEYKNVDVDSQCTYLFFIVEL